MPTNVKKKQAQPEVKVEQKRARSNRKARSTGILKAAWQVALKLAWQVVLKEALKVALEEVSKMWEDA